MVDWHEGGLTIEMLDEIGASLWGTHDLFCDME